MIPSLTPLTPPHSEDERLAWLRLLRSRRVGIATFYRLMHDHGTAANALAELPKIASSAGVAGYAACPEGVARAELSAARLAGARPLFFGAPDYPAGLADLPDPPPLLWAVGDVALHARATLALVGARNASSLGLRMARALAQGIGKAGYVTVSGLARGIDAAVHAASLETGTIAVLAGGVDVVYPSENAVLTQEIGERGLLLSEQPMGLVPQARHFPRRNRLISGLARATCVVEAAAKSGSLITARDALDQGRDVLAVPGHPFDARAAGANMLIRDGATLVRGPDDLIEALAACTPAIPARPDPHPRGRAGRPAAPPEGAVPSGPPRAPTADLHRRILDRLGPSPTAEDQLIRDLGAPASTVTAGIVALELDGHLARHPGGLLSRRC